jgi:hypothetical protein
MSDKRLLHWLPYSLAQKVFIRRLTRGLDPDFVPEKLFVAITFDVEQDFGSKALQLGSKTAKEFLLQLSQVFYEKLTLFVQGNLVQDLADYLHALQNKNEIGLHGFNHELWGRSKWFLKKLPLTTKQKIELIEMALSSFKKNNLKKPVSFRAPDTIIDSESLSLLERYGFHVDSSKPNFLSIPIFKRSRLMRIPVTASPILKFSCKYLVPYSYHPLFDIANLRYYNNSRFLEIIRTLCSIQNHLGYPCHLVFLAHSWEFRRWNVGGLFKYCSPSNFKFMKEKMSFLEKDFNTNYATMFDLFHLLKRQKRIRAQNFDKQYFKIFS